MGLRAESKLQALGEEWKDEAEDGALTAHFQGRAVIVISQPPSCQVGREPIRLSEAQLHYTGLRMIDRITILHR